MFYSYDILHPRKGKLAVIWLAATGRLQFQKRQDRNFREAMKVIVHRSCEEILQYVLLKKIGTIKEHKGRFSLYLSSMLMFGTVRIYHRQIRFLLDEVIGTYEKLQRQSILLRSLDTSTAGQQRVTLREPLMSGEWLEMDWSLPMLPPEPIVNISVPTPRKREKSNTSDPEMELLRTEIIPEVTIDATAQTLLVDWLETPNRARPEDITLREQYLAPMSTQPLTLQVPELLAEQALGPIDLGPPFLFEEPLGELPPDPTIDSVRRRLDLDDQLLTDKRVDEEDHETPLDAQRTKDRDEIPEQQFLEIRPLTEETPLPPEEVTAIPPAEETPGGQPTVPQAELKRKRAAPDAVIEETPVQPQEQPAAARPLDTSQIQLDPVAGRPAKRGKTQSKPRKLKIDHVLQISREVIRDQAINTDDIIRQQDTVHVHWWQKIISAKNLMTQATHRTCLGSPLNHLLSRHYHSDTHMEHWDFERPVKRQLLLPDESVEHHRLGQSAISEDTLILQDASSLLSSNLESTRTSGSKSVLRTPNVSQIEPILQEPVQLLPIEEEQIDPELQNFAVGEALPPVDQPLVEPDFPIEQLLVPSAIRKETEGSVSTRQQAETPQKRQIHPKTARQIDEEICLATPPSVHSTEVRSHLLPYAPPSPLQPILSPHDSRQVVRVQADVHQPPSSMQISPPSAEALEMFPIPETGEFTVQGQVPHTSPHAQHLEETAITMTHEDAIVRDKPHRPLGPILGKELFIPDTISPIRHPLSTTRVIDTPDTMLPARLDAEEAVLNTIDSETSGKKLTLTDLLPENPTRKHVANLFSNLLELHKKRSVSLSQERNYDPINVQRL